MQMRTACGVALVLGFGAIGACVGDNPGAGDDDTPLPDSSIGSSSTSSGAGGSSGSDAASSSGGSSGSDDAGHDAAAPGCGFPGEACCAAPVLPCNAGTKCGADQKCRVSDVWAVGGASDFPNSFGENATSAHFDGETWGIPQAMATDTHVVQVYPFGENNYRAVTMEGHLLTHSTPDDIWRACGPSYNGAVSNACAYPSGFVRQASIFGTADDFWIAGIDKMYRCKPTCAESMPGLTGESWGDGQLVGTSTSDVWFPVYDHVLHFDGVTWTRTDLAQSRALFAAAPNDVWSGDSLLQHFDGATWSAEQTVNGAPLPGSIYQMSGSAPDDIWAVGHNGSDGSHPGFAAHYDGTVWDLKALPAGARDVVSVWAPSRIEAFIASRAGAIYRWDGAQWTEMQQDVGPDGGARDHAWESIVGSAKPRR